VNKKARTAHGGGRCPERRAKEEYNNRAMGKGTRVKFKKGWG